MANPAVRASIPSAATDTDETSIVCTHPTGLTAGDLMVLYVNIFNVSSGRAITTPSGWTVQDTDTLGSQSHTLTVYKKIATSGDVSAGSTTVSFTGGTVDKSGYAMFAITGAASGSEITTSEVSSFDPGGVTTVTDTISLTPPTPESLVIAAFVVRDTNLSAILTASSFALVPSTTMTERVDVGVRDGASDGFSLFVATGEYDGTTEITSSSVTVSESVTGFDCSIITLLVNGRVDATATNAVFEISSTIFQPSISLSGSGSNALLEVSPTLTETNTNGTTPTQWVNETKPATTWANETL